MTDDLTRDEIRERANWLKSIARQGANELAARAATTERKPNLTDAESAAIARRKLDQEDAR